MNNYELYSTLSDVSTVQAQYSTGLRDDTMRKRATGKNWEQPLFVISKLRENLLPFQIFINSKRYAVRNTRDVDCILPLHVRIINSTRPRLCILSLERTTDLRLNFYFLICLRFRTRALRLLFKPAWWWLIRLISYFFLIVPLFFLICPCLLM